MPFRNPQALKDAEAALQKKPDHLCALILRGCLAKPEVHRNLFLGAADEYLVSNDLKENTGAHYQYIGTYLMICDLKMCDLYNRYTCICNLKSDLRT